MECPSCGVWMEETVSDWFVFECPECGTTWLSSEGRPIRVFADAKTD